jgi:hypothetical protein
MAVAAAACILGTMASPALARFDQLSGYRDCGSYKGYLHAKYNDQAVLQPPGGLLYTYTNGDGLWHVKELTGTYAGNWYAMGTPYLDLDNTWAACRYYGG